MIKQETFQTTESLVLENSYAVIASEDNVQLEITVGINDEEYGWFEMYDIESEGIEWYAEGGLIFEGKTLVDYDGVFDLPTPILNKLEEWGYDVSDIRG